MDSVCGADARPGEGIAVIAIITIVLVYLAIATWVWPSLLETAPPELRTEFPVLTYTISNILAIAWLPVGIAFLLDNHL